MRKDAIRRTDCFPEISVIIVSWNTVDLLRACLSSIRELIGRSEIEVFVVDNDSRDDSCTMVSTEFPEVILIKNKENRGFARATNQGYKESGGKYCLLLNSDTEASVTAIMRSAEYLNSNLDVAAVGCRLTYPTGGYQSSCFRFPSLRGITLSCFGLSQMFPNSCYLNYERYGHTQWVDTCEVDCVMGSFMMLRRSALHADFLFDEGYFMYAEETELCWGFRKSGLKVSYFPQVSIIHHWGGSSGKNSTVSAWAFEGVRRGTLRFLYRNRGALRAYVANAIYFLTLIPRAIYWVSADAIKSVTRRRFTRVKSLRLRVLPFHLRVFVKPEVMMERWGAPK